LLFLQGGSGVRLFPVTMIANERLLPAFDKPKIHDPRALLYKPWIYIMAHAQCPSRVTAGWRLRRDRATPNLPNSTEEQAERQLGNPLFQGR
jgi:hypothetical protein